MRQMFGEHAYPTTQVLPIGERTGPTVQPRSELSFLRTPRRRRMIAVAAAVLGVGLVVGLGAPALLGSDAEPTPAGAAAPVQERPAEPAHPSSSEAPAPADQLEVDGPADEAEIELDEPNATPRSRKPRKSKRTSSKPERRKDASAQASEYLPPSRRGQ
jgi:hypothetical protein